LTPKSGQPFPPDSGLPRKGTRRTMTHRAGHPMDNRWAAGAVAGKLSALRVMLGPVVVVFDAELCVRAA
jgi:hypothetical protein